MPFESRATGASESPDGTEGTETSTSTGAGSIAWTESFAVARGAAGVVAPIEVTIWRLGAGAGAGGGGAARMSDYCSRSRPSLREP